MMPKKPQSFTMRLSESRTTMTLKMPSTVTLTALELENLMREFARMRASMTPALPDTDPGPETLWSVVPATRWYVQQDEMPTQVRLSLMHLGFGWIWMPLSADATKRLSDMLLHYLQSRPQLQ